MLFRSLLLHLAFSALLSAPSPSAIAEVHVGPRDGTPVESLAPIAMPVMGPEVALPTDQLAKLMESQANWPMAALEWQRLAMQTQGPAEVNAFLHGALALEKMGHISASVLTLQKAITADANAVQPTSRAPELLFHMARLTTGVSQTNVLAQLGQTPQNPWARAALWQAVLQQARTGTLTQTYNLPQAESLRTAQLTFGKKAQSMAYVAAGLGLIPGAGHIMLGNPTQGAMMLIFTLLFALAFLSACRHRHYAYAFLLVIPAVSLWLNSPLLAYQIATQQAHTTFNTALTQKWAPLIPVPQESTPSATPQPTFAPQAQPQPLPPLVQKAVSFMVNHTPAEILPPLHPTSSTQPHALQVPVGVAQPAPTR